MCVRVSHQRSPRRCRPAEAEAGRAPRCCGDSGVVGSTRSSPGGLHRGPRRSRASAHHLRGTPNRTGRGEVHETLREGRTRRKKRSSLPNKGGLQHCSVSATTTGKSEKKRMSTAAELYGGASSAVCTSLAALYCFVMSYLYKFRSRSCPRWLPFVPGTNKHPHRKQ